MTRMYIFNHNEVEESQNVMILTAMTIIKFWRASQYSFNPNETAQPQPQPQPQHHDQK